MPDLRSPSSEEDDRFMGMALRLALRGKGRTRPNPLVGCVLVRQGRVIGKGFHRRPGSPHAEVVAIESAQEDVRGSTLYVNLEPCAHYGRTPPCLDLILERQIGRVVVGTVDPNPLVNGRSIQALRAKGVEVRVGVLEAACRRMNEVFFKFVQTGKPFVTLKAGLSLDGKIAAHTGKSQWITCEASRRSVHRLRSEVDAILVGIGTVFRDNPLLTVRGIRGASQPLRVVLDSELRIPLDAAVLGPEAETLVATTERAPVEKATALRARGVQVEVFSADRAGRVPLGALLRRLAERDTQHVLIEGGSRVFTTALEEGEGDRLLLYVAPILLGGEKAPGILGGRGAESPQEALRVYDLVCRRVGLDLLLEGRLKRREPEEALSDRVAGCGGLE